MQNDAVQLPGSDRMANDSIINAGQHFIFTRGGVEVVGDPSYEEWEAVFLKFKQVETCIQWWLGDMLNIAERRYGETYAQAVDEHDYTKGYLANMKYVAGKIETSRRRENLSFSHHQVVAALPKEGQDYWLDLAEKEGIATRHLRNKIKKTVREEESCPHPETITKCRKCGEEIA